MACATTLALFMLLCSNVSADTSKALLWFEDGQPTAQAEQALAILAEARDDGLNPTHYNATGLRQAFEAARTETSGETRAQLDRTLTAAMRRYLSDLHFGQVDPHQIQENFSGTAASGFHPGAYLTSAVRANRLTEAVAEAAPTLPLYASLRQALAQYRQMAANQELSALWRANLPPLPGSKLQPGESYEGLQRIADRLAALGDLPTPIQIGTVYTDDLVVGIKSFQLRHGLNADGVIGRQTFIHLGVSPASRVHQIELSMERLRWTPLLQAPRMIAVNVPEQMLEAYEIINGTVTVKVRMRVITGNALETRTPIFDGSIRTIEFSPYWNVPLTIARDEIIPRALKDSSYFARNGFEFVSGNDSNSTLFTESLDQVLRGVKRIRQRPGPRNPMGDIKFVIPNKDSIYLHHTESPQLFAKQRRDLSHGCIRVEDPVALARFVLNNDPAWDETRIREAMGQPEPTVLRLHEPVRVVIGYKTVQVRNDGQVFFFSDIYGQDRLLDQAIKDSRDAIN